MAEVATTLAPARTQGSRPEPDGDLLPARSAQVLEHKSSVKHTRFHDH
jgi:hypothetical protein